ncbi:MAG: hypothetical protein K6A35_06950 [bacterium]|nr:hypothetical protein [bacterium]
MYIPKGNILIEDVDLSNEDMREMQANLSNDGFTGYIKLDLENSSAYLFYDGGAVLQVLEVDSATGAINLQLEQRLMNRIKLDTIKCSSYVTSKRVVHVLMGLFAFQSLYLDYAIKQRDMPRILEKLRDGSYNGLMKLSTREGTCYLAIDHGEILRDRFCYNYGEILSGYDAVDHILNFEFDSEGATMSVYAERLEEIEAKRSAKEEELEKIKTLIVKSDGGFLRASDVVKVDNYIVREWNIADVKSTFTVEIETPDGSLYEYKCQAGAKFGDRAGIPPAMMKKLGVVEGDSISVRPL